MEEKIIEQLNRIERYSMMAAKAMLTIDEAAVYTGLSKSWLYKATCNHTLPHYKPNGKIIYFDRTELDAWMKQNRISTAAEADMAANSYIVGTTGSNGRRKGGRK